MTDLAVSHNPSLRHPQDRNHPRQKKAFASKQQLGLRFNLQFLYIKGVACVEGFLSQVRGVRVVT